MDIPFKPSLKQMCMAKLALHLLYDKDIETMLYEENFLPFHDQFPLKVRLPRYEDWKKIENLALEKVHFLPGNLRTKVVGLLRPMARQVGYWQEKYYFIVRWDTDNSVEKMICWKMDGTIDYELTAKKIVGNVNLYRYIRLSMATIHFMEDDILNLYWEDFHVLHCDYGIESAFFWDVYLGHKIEKPWTEEIGSFDLQDYKWERVSCFFRYLSEDERLDCIECLRFPNCDDLLSCLSQIDEQERMVLFTYNPTLISNLLQWPLQIYFIDMANKLWSRMTVKYFEDILRNIIEDCLLLGLQDFDYLQLLRKFWNSSPLSLQEKMKNRPFFEFVKVPLNYNNETEKVSLTEVLERHFYGPPKRY